ncbi:glycosyltransferase family A protein [Cryobacterium sp. Y50]|uniref:glycosyltransferase family 2 protein n=1 Tax=Cryobacterium sp. Y50 TaxID=2048286 RepID=UPI000CE3D9B1|nr:glycosyltransferase family A protein [Cryobacterium sp. Y50]
MRPLVSVVCPTYNRGAQLDETIASVVAQTEARWELIVVDDASTDDTAAVADAWAEQDDRISVLRQGSRHGHPAEPRNIGAASSTAELVAYLDHDDVWHDGHLATALGVLATSDAVAVASGYEHVDATGVVVAGSNHLEMVWHEQIQELGPLFEPSRVVVRATALERAGGWRIGVGLEDWDLWMRLVDDGGRFATVVDRTVRLLQDPSTRRYSTTRPHRIPVGLFRTPADADACRRQLLGDESSTQLTAAAIADVTDWFESLEASGTLVLPCGSAGSIDAILASTDRTDFSTAFREYHLLQRAGLIELSLPVWSATRGLADRIKRRLREVHTRQLALIDQTVVRFGGEPVRAAESVPTA